MLRWVYLGAGSMLLALVSLAVTWSAGGAVTALWSIGMGALALAFVKLVDSQGAQTFGRIAPPLMGGVVVAVSALLKWLTSSPGVGWPDGAGILAAVAAASLGASLWTTGRVRECFICKQPIASGLPFTCPRCHQTICTRPTCWTARHFRCRYCDEREVIIFPIDERWWNARLGPRATAGACSSCYKEAGEADLRECGQCRWPMCRRCWDYHNGQCSHCEWIVPDLPAALTPFLRSSRPVARGERPAARRRV